jgi:1-acyl-sn-glycerol-3-phosphate acyltransferase
VFYWLLKVVLTPLLRPVWRPWAEGVENIPADGPAIIASNHLAFCDSIFMPLLVPGRKVTFLAKSEYFTERGLKGWLKRLFFTSVGQVPIDRSGGGASQAALDTGVRLLREGHLLGIYPEGTRSPDGRLYRGRTGVAWMALNAGVKVIPCAMIDTEVINPPGSVLWKLRPRPGVRFGKPLDFSRYAGMEGDRFVLRSMTDEIMYELMLLSGQEYVDTYATKAKAELAREARAARKSAESATKADVTEVTDVMDVMDVTDVTDVRRPQTRAS